MMTGLQHNLVDTLDDIGYDSCTTLGAALFGADPISFQSAASIPHIVVSIEGQQLATTLSLDKREKRMFDDSPI